jgi:uncharacterized protein (DUF608 family)
MTEPSNHSRTPAADAVSLDRRRFLKSSSLTAAGFAFSRMPVMAGPFTREDFDKLVPADKKLSPEWVKSLFARGERMVYRGKELDKIGMPVGGICTGQLYLGGDGRLWHWDIFNQPIGGTGDSHYAKPMVPSSPLAQKFSLKIGDQTHTLDRDGFADISFRGEYPLGLVEYADAKVPLNVKLEAFSPFMPLNADDSGLPATILQFTLRNTSVAVVEAVLTGELENGVCLQQRNQNAVLRNRTVRETGFTALVCSAERPANGQPVKGEQPVTDEALKALPGYGTMTLALLGQAADQASADATAPFAERLSGSIGRILKLAPGASVTVTFVLAWHFPNLSLAGPLNKAGNYYATRFASAVAVVQYVTAQFERLTSQTRLWRDTWYDSTLPFWLLDRTLSNVSILATRTANRMANGRFYGTEGVACCEGTCTHVWQYEQAMGRLFPELDIVLRERTDFDPAVSFKPDGMIDHRGEFNAGHAIDGQAGTLLRAYRDHQMSPDNAFLKRNYPGIKKAMQWLISQDGNADGILEGAQHNTLDAAWYGPVAWLSGLYLASLRALVAMAGEMDDHSFAAECRAIAEAGSQTLVKRLFDGEYFINLIDPKHVTAINSGTGCEIDQVMGQGWAFQVGLGRVLPQKETRAALQSLWRYNFSPDVGPYRAVNGAGRWYAMAGEAGLLMCTFPRKDWSFADAIGKNANSYCAGYFNECMNGFEYQAAGHMIWEGLVQEGLAVTRAVHDRYHASKRNPWNEIECGDHYARSMASYGVFIAACGFEYHGPKQHIGFAPKLTPENFKAAFTAAEGWGTLSQNRTDKTQTNKIEVKSGGLRVKSLAFELPPGATLKTSTVAVGTQQLTVKATQSGQRVELTLAKVLALKANETITTKLEFA